MWLGHLAGRGYPGYERMLEAIRTTVSERCGLDFHNGILAGVSGGPDSLFLMHILWKLGANVIVAHLDHQLRPESKTEACAVADLARQMGFQVILGSVDVTGLAERETLSLEEAARIARYRFLFNTAAKNDVQAVAVGHTADDQVETVLMHMLRGAGTAGLRGMAYRATSDEWGFEYPLVRPLLGTWRTEINAYLSENQLVPIQDPSNEDVLYYRNYLRHEVIPYLEKNHPGFRKRIWRTAEVLSGDYAVLESIITEKRDLIVRNIGEGYVQFDHPSFLVQPVGIQRGLSRWAINHLKPGLRDIGFDHVQAVLEFARFPSRSRQCDLTAGLRVELDNDVLWITSWGTELSELDTDSSSWLRLQPGSARKLDPPCIVSLGGGLSISLVFAEEIVEERAKAFQNTDPYSVWLDTRLIQIPLELRTRLPGDRFQPLGMGGQSMKLSDFMINEKLPKEARDSWPLIVSGDDIAWIPGYRLAHPFRMSKETKAALVVKVERKRLSPDKEKL